MSYALITGAAQRIGGDIALFLAKNEWDIIIHYSASEEQALNLQQSILALGGKCILYKEDFLHKHSDAIQEITNEFPIDLLINNACIFENDNLKDIDEGNLYDSLKVNFFNPVMLSKFLSQNNRDAGQINIINILDTIIFKLPKNFASYYFSKVALANFTRLAAKLYAPAIRVNGIALGQILKNPKQSEENFIRTKKATPLGYSGSIDEICSTIDFIMKTKSLTGQIISLDGGAHLDNANYP